MPLDLISESQISWRTCYQTLKRYVLALWGVLRILDSVVERLMGIQFYVCMANQIYFWSDILSKQ